MDKFDRFQLLHQIFKAHRRPVAIRRLAEKLECSEKTVKRTLYQRRDCLAAPIQYFPEQKGWQYDGSANELFELPGLWLTSDELQSLALLMHSMENFGKGLLRSELLVIDQQIDRLLKARGIDRSAFDQQIKVLPMAGRQITNHTFIAVSEALLHKKQLEVQYLSYSQQKTQRTLSPIKLVYYRENWYLDAWCHLREAMRTFSLARIERLQTTRQPAKVVPHEKQKAHFEQSYGLFAGPAKQTATLRFNAEIAREISLQSWHPQQVGEWDGDNYLLSFPYSDERELLQDILRHIPNIYVEAPAQLRKAVHKRLQAGLELFSGKG